MLDSLFPSHVAPPIASSSYKSPYGALKVEYVEKKSQHPNLLCLNMFNVDVDAPHPLFNGVDSRSLTCRV